MKRVAQVLLDTLYGTIAVFVLSQAVLAGSPLDAGSDAQASPYTAIGRFTGTMACTAALILHPRILVTAGHCVVQRNGALKHSELSVQLSSPYEASPGPFHATLWAVGATQPFTQQSTSEAANDWAILVLDRLPQGIRAFLLDRHGPESVTSMRQVIMPSYSRDMNGTQVLGVEPACSARGIRWGVLVHDCRALPGSSGAPLLIREQHWYAVIGIHSGSIWASDAEGRVGAFIGNSGVGAWTFGDALHKLLRQLNSGEEPKDSGS